MRNDLPNIIVESRKFFAFHDSFPYFWFPSDAMKYYKTDSRNISFREYWHLSPRFFWFGWLNKILGRPMNFIRGIPEPLPFKDRIIETSEMPREILERLTPSVRDLQKLGFDQFWYYTNRQSLMGGLGYGVQCLHSSRQILAHIIYVAYQSRERFVITLVSGLPDGTVLGTTNKKRDFNPPFEYKIRRKVGADAENLLAMHQQSLAALTSNAPPQSFAGLVEVAAFEDKLMRQSHADKIKRGIWVEMTEAEVTALRAQKGIPPPIPPATRPG